MESAVERDASQSELDQGKEKHRLCKMMIRAGTICEGDPCSHGLCAVTQCSHSTSRLLQCTNMAFCSDRAATQSRESILMLH
jgi:hypothetical protein